MTSALSKASETLELLLFSFRDLKGVTDALLSASGSSSPHIDPQQLS